MTGGIIFGIAFSALCGLTGYRIGQLRERWHQWEKAKLPESWRGDGEVRSDGEKVGDVQWKYKPVSYEKTEA